MEKDRDSKSSLKAYSDTPVESWDGSSTDVLAPASPSHYSAWRAFKAGFAYMWRARSVTWWLYVANLIWAVLWSLPLMTVLSRVFRGRPAGEVLAHRWDLEVLVEVLLDHPEVSHLAMGLAVFSVIGYALFSVLLTAGVAGAIAERRRTTAVEVAHRAVLGFPRVLGMSLVFLLIMGASLFLLSALLGLGSIAAEDLSWGSRVAVQVLLALPALILLALVDAAMDYARIHVATHQGKASFWASFKFGWKLMFRRGASAVWLHLGFSLVSLAALAVLVVLPTNLDAGGSLHLLIGFAIWQVFVMFRVGVRVSGLAGQKLYSGSAPEYVA